MSTSNETRPHPGNRLNAAFQGGSAAKPPEVIASTSMLRSLSSSSIGFYGTRPEDPLGAGYRNAAAKNSYNLGFLRNEGKEKRQKEAAELPPAKKLSSRASSSHTSWNKAPISVDSVTKSSQGSQGGSSNASSSKQTLKVRKSATKAIDLDPSDEEDDFVLTDKVAKSKSKSRDTNWIFSSQESTTSTSELPPPLGNKRKVSATVSQSTSSKASAKKQKRVHEYVELDSPVAPSTKLAKQGNTGSSRSSQSLQPQSSGSRRKELEMRPAASSTKTSKAARQVTDLTTSSPVSAFAFTSKPSKRKRTMSFDSDDDDSGITDPEEDTKPSVPRPKARPSAGTSKPKAKAALHSKQGVPTKPSERPAVSSAKPREPLSNAENRREHQAKHLDLEDTPKARPRATPSAALAKSKGRAPVLYQSGRSRIADGSDSDPDAPVVASSPRTAKKPTATTTIRPTSGVAQQSSYSDLEDLAQSSKQRPRPRPAVSSHASSSASKPFPSVLQDPDIIDISESPVREPSKKKGRRRILQDEDEEEEPRSSSPEEQFGAATQAMWFENALNGKNVDTGEMRVESEASQCSTQTEIELEASDDEDVFGDKIVRGPICPFCDGPLPSHPSSRLLQMLEKLCRRLDLSLRDGSHNLHALNLPSTVTAATCKRHRDEKEVIPKGLAKKYPAPGTIDFAALGGRFLRGCMREVVAIVQGKMESDFLNDAKKEWEERGARKMGNVINEWSSFEQELPGYYGQQGFEAIMAILNEHLVEVGIISAHRTAPLDVQSYLRRVMLPEAAIRFIQEDYDSCSRKKALRILRESRPYGAAVFATEVADEAETKAERREREKEEREHDQQRKLLLASEGKQAEALRRAEEAIQALKAMLSD